MNESNSDTRWLSLTDRFATITAQRHANKEVLFNKTTFGHQSVYLKNAEPLDLGGDLTISCMVDRAVILAALKPSLMIPVSCHKPPPAPHSNGRKV